MNRKARRAALADQHRKVASLPKKLVPIPPEDFPSMPKLPIKAWWSRKYLVQLHDESEQMAGLRRLSVCRVTMGKDGRWDDKLTWDELQAIKLEVGFGDCYAVEVYPKEWNVVNVANMRHLWLLPEPLAIGWKNDRTR